METSPSSCRCAAGGLCGTARGKARELGRGVHHVRCSSSYGRCNANDGWRAWRSHDRLLCVRRRHPHAAGLSGDGHQRVHPQRGTRRQRRRLDRCRLQRNRLPRPSLSLDRRLRHGRTGFRQRLRRQRRRLDDRRHPRPRGRPLDQRRRSDLPGGKFESQASAVNRDGSVIVGQGQSAAGYEAFRWTSGGGMVGLGVLPGRFGSWAAGVSSNGSVAAGTSWGSSLNSYQAFRWTGGTGMQGLGFLPGGSMSQAFAVSGDGSTIVGHSTSSAAHLGVAFRWTSSSGMVALGDLPGGDTQSFAQAVSGDGSVIVGWGSTLAGTEAFTWTQSGGLRRLWDVLLQNGINPAADGWTSLNEGLGLSLDGNTIVGYGERNGVGEAFVARLEPAPSTHAWASTAASADWATPGNWNPPATPASNWIAQVINVQPGLSQAVRVSNSSTVRSIVVAGQSQQMTLIVQSGATLTATNDVQVGSLGRVNLVGGTLASPVVNIAAGAALGGSGAVQGSVTNAGTVSPGDASPLDIGGDFTQQAGAQLVIDLARSEEHTSELPSPCNLV